MFRDVSDRSWPPERYRDDPHLLARKDNGEGADDHPGADR
jgi:hypothetical protein